MVSTPAQGNPILSVTQGTTGAKIVSGRTTPGATNWFQYDGGIKCKVDTTAAGFTETPIYVTSIGGDKYHWGTTGISSIYEATPTSFTIELRWDKGFWDNNPLDIKEANSYKWHINWIAIEPSTKPSLLDQRVGIIDALDSDRKRNTWHKVTFDVPFAEGKRVVVIPMTQTYVGAHTPGLRLQNVTNLGFEIRFDELVGIGNLSDGGHSKEIVGWAAYGF